VKVKLLAAVTLLLVLLVLYGKSAESVGSQNVWVVTASQPEVGNAHAVNLTVGLPLSIYLGEVSASGGRLTQTTLEVTWTGRTLKIVEMNSTFLVVRGLPQAPAEVTSSRTVLIRTASPGDVVYIRYGYVPTGYENQIGLFLK
jgi:hypothetical protein